jgi:acetyl-CoA carboxylase/biotin carboxylase 1
MAVGQIEGANGAMNGSASAAAARRSLPSHFIGGSHLDVAQPGKVKDFVAAHEGHTVITKV